MPGVMSDESRRSDHSRPRIAGAAVTAAAVACATAGLANPSDAAIAYGDFAGTTVDYINVTEDDQNLFGAPIVTGDTITFSPVGFEVASSGAAPPRLVSADITMVIDARPGYSISGFRISEAGAFSLLGFGTGATAVMAGFNVDINVLEVDGVAVPGGILLAQSSLSADFNFADEGLVVGKPWQQEHTIDVAALALSAGITGEVTLLSLTIQNNLAAQSEGNTTAFIDKKALNGLSITLPEPSSMGLLALGGLLMLRRRG